MAITVKHKFVSAIPDGADATVVRPSNWNDDHDLTGTISIANGGTGQATANDAFNALAPSQTGNTGKYLTTNGTDSSWAANSLGTVTSVAATVPSVLSIAGSPITTSGTLAITYSGTALPVLNGGTGVTTSTGTTNVVLSGSPTIVTPVIAQINDANGNAELKFSTIASAVNQITIENAATGNPVHISATGTDTNIGIHLTPKGASGYVNVQGGVDSTKRFMLNPDGGTTNTRTMLSTSQTVDRTLTLPDATDTLVGKATTDTFTNKSISGSTNTLSNIGNASLTNSAITINGTSTSLGGSISVGTVTSVTGTAPVVSSGGATPAISMAAATTSVNGYLTSTDWTTFNNKGSGTVTSVAAITLGTTGTDLSSTVATGTTTPVITLQVPTASASNRGALSSTDWSTFNGKQATLVSGTNIKTVSGTTLLGSGDLGVIGATYGGTGQSSYAVGDIVYASTTTALSKLADVATGSALISGGVGVAPSYGKIGLTTHVSGTLPIANGGTNATTASITSFNNITGYTASGATGTTSTNLVFSTAPTVTNPTLTGFIETVFAATGTTPALSPTNGTIQTWTLSGSSTPTAGTWTAGASLSLQITASTNTITWSSLPVTWIGGTAPTLSTTVTTNIELWKIGSTIYGALVGLA